MASVKSSRSAMDTSRSRSSKVDVEKMSSRSTGRGGGDTLPKIGKEHEEKPVDDYDDESSAPVMFGDPFGNRGDYSKGIFYGGRKKFLYGKKAKAADKDKKLNALEPPLDFMTMRQRRNKAKMSKTQVQLISKRLDFKRKDDNDEAAILARAEAKKNMQQSKRKVLVIKNQATSKYDWTVQRQAGCQFWVHKPTGTISSEMPCCEDEEDDSVCTTSDQESAEGFPTPHKQLNTHSLQEEGSNDDDGDKDSEFPPATGSLVYDSYEFNNFVNMLDEMQVKEKSSRKL